MCCARWATASISRRRRFSAWTPKALGTIKILPGTLADRAIIIPMSRKRPGDVVARVLSTDNRAIRPAALAMSQVERGSRRRADRRRSLSPEGARRSRRRQLAAAEGHRRCAGRSLVEALLGRRRGAVARARRGRDDRRRAAPGVEGDLRRARRRRSSTGRASRTARRCTPTTSCRSCTTPTPAGRNTDGSGEADHRPGLARLLKGFRIKPGTRDHRRDAEARLSRRRLR